MKIGIVICSRTDSQRLPNKPFKKINGVPLIELLIQRLKPTGLPIILAVPTEQAESYEYLRDRGAKLWLGHADDPLARMAEAARECGLDAVVRVTHDKIMVRHQDIKLAATIFEKEDGDYLFSSRFIPGTGFEIISTVTLVEAAQKHKNVEFIGYAARSLAQRIIEFNPRHPVGDYRLLVDYPSDVLLFDVLFSQLGNNASLRDVVMYLNTNPEIKRINRLPRLTVYTCAYNAEAWIERAMRSVERQRIFHDIEYIIIDDHSKDRTTELIARFASGLPNVRWLRNSENIGLASSSNLALKMAQGDYIMRLDADDFLVSITATEEMLVKIMTTGNEIVYPDNYHGTYEKIQDGSEERHTGGAIFDKRAINHIKFTDGLRAYEGLDLWLRARDQLKIGYLKKPIFFYHQHPKSMSKTNLRRREKIRIELLTTHAPELLDAEI